MSQPTCSIVVPVFNRGSLVGKTLDSIYAQDYRPLSLIVVDNNSTDHTLEVLHSWSGEHNSQNFKVTVLSETKPGAAAARNKGLSVVDSDYVMFFDSDDIMEPQHLSSVMSAIKENNCPDIVGWDVAINHLDGRQQLMEFPSGDYFFRHFFNSILSTQRYAVKTRFLHDCGAWNETLLGWNDYELGIRLLRHAPRIAKAEGAPMVKVLRQADSITGTKYSDKSSYWENCLDEIQRVLPPEYQNGINLRRMVLAALYRREKSHESDRLRHAVIASCRSRKEARLLDFAYRYTLLHGRGIHYILRRFVGF